MGYAPTEYRLWNPSERELVILRDVKFIDTVQNHKKKINTENEVTILRSEEEDTNQTQIREEPNTRREEEEDSTSEEEFLEAEEEQESQVQIQQIG